jgi:hypothetical protein
MDGQEFLEAQHNEQGRHMPRSIFEQESNTQSMIEDLNRRSRRIGKQLSKASDNMAHNISDPELQKSIWPKATIPDLPLKLQGKAAKRKLNDSPVVSEENISNELNNKVDIQQEHDPKDHGQVYQKYSIRNKLEISKQTSGRGPLRPQNGLFGSSTHQKSNQLV